MIRTQDWRWLVPLESLPVATAALTVIGLVAQTEVQGVDDQGRVIVCLRASYAATLQEAEWTLLGRIGELSPWEDK